MTDFSRWRRALLLSITALALASCGGTPDRDEPEETLAQETESASVETINLDLPPSVYRAAFNRIESSLARFDWMQAVAELDALPQELFTPEDSAYSDYLRARGAFIQGDAERALSLVQRAREISVNQGLQYRLNSFEHFMLSIGGQSVPAARVAAEMLSWLPADHAAGWKRKTWANLQRATPEALANELTVASDPQWIAWLQLAADSAAGDDSAAAVMRWLNRYPDHVAANPLPGGLGAEIATAGRTGRIALLLPLSGRLAPAGTAVLEGYLAAHYAGEARGAAQDELVILDTARYPSASQAYDEAVRRGAGAVVGPLSKDAVAELATRLERPVPILALNRIEQVLPAAGGALVQMSLSPEDEATTLADAAFGRGARQALVIRPAGSWGDTVEQALRERWAQLGGKIISGSSYNERSEHSASVKAALGIEASEQRARRVRDMLATEVEFTPRRRSDIDVVFLLTRNSADGRSIKPLLSFYYAGGIPVFALSGINSGRVDSANRDLAGTFLVEMPWLLGANPELRIAITSGDTGSDNYTRLNALGADAHRVQSGFARLQAGPDALYRGATGLLTLDPELRIRRELTLAKFDGEVARVE